MIRIKIGGYSEEDRDSKIPVKIYLRYVKGARNIWYFGLFLL